MGHQDDGKARQFGDPCLREALLGRGAAEDQIPLNGEHHHDPGGAVEGAVLQEAQDAAPGVGVPEGLRQPKGQGQVDEDHPHQVEGVHDGQATQVDNGRVGHSALSEADHVESEEVGWKTDTGAGMDEAVTVVKLK